jgi:D-3-phosphoglycerate dehydrogenase
MSTVGSEGALEVLVTEAISDDGIDLLESVAVVRVWREQRPLTREEWAAELPTAAAVLITSRDGLDAEAIAHAKKLQVICKYGAKPTNLDFAAAEDAGVRVLWTQASNTVSVAEWTLVLMLAKLRRLPEHVGELRRGGWRSGELLGTELFGKTVGLIGIGQIGQEVARRLRAFGAEVIAYDPFVADDAIDAVGATRASLEDLLGNAHVVSLHCELSPETAGLLGSAQIAMMRRDAVVVNTARAGLIDTQALVDAIREKQIGGAALDVFDQEPLPLDHPLRNLEDVLLTPHTAGLTQEAMEREGRWAAEDVCDVLQGREPRHFTKWLSARR